MRISPLSMMYLVGIGFTFAGMGLLTAGMVIPGLLGIAVGVFILYRGVNASIRVKEMEAERKAREELEREKEEREKKRRALQKKRGEVEPLYPCESLVRKGLRDIKPQIAEALEALVRSKDLDKISYEELADELEMLLLGVQWRWPEFDRFMGEVEGRRILPVVWRELGILPWQVPSAANSVVIGYVLKDFNELSKSAKLLLMRNDLVGVTEKRLLPIEEFKEKVKSDESGMALEELIERGMVERLSDRADRLGLLKSERLVEIMEKYEIRVKGRGKEAAISKILEIVPEEELEAIFRREELPEEVIRGGIIASRDISAAIKWERARIRLLAHTIYFTQKNLKTFKSLTAAGEEEPRIRVVGGGWGDCAVCREKLHREFRRPISIKGLKTEDIPPFHPGCRCTLEEVKEG